MENIKEIVDKLVGSITPAGESHKDKERFENLKIMCDLVERLVYDIHLVTREKDRYESSMKEMGLYAQKFLDNLKEEL